MDAVKHPVLFSDSGDFDTFLEHVKNGATLSNAAQAVGYKWPTVRRMIESRNDLSERFSEAWEERKQSWADKVEQEVHERAFDRDDQKSATILLRLAEKYDPEMRRSVELTGAGGGPIQLSAKASPLDALSIEELQALAQQARQKQLGPGDDD